MNMLRSANRLRLVRIDSAPVAPDSLSLSLRPRFLINPMSTTATSTSTSTSTRASIRSFHFECSKLSNIRLAEFTQTPFQAAASHPPDSHASQQDSSSSEPVHLNFHLDQPLSPEEQNQVDWHKWHDLRWNWAVLFGILASFASIRYWYNRENDHFLHHRHVSEPYSFFMNRQDTIASGWWPGRACQFFELTCFHRTYYEAEQLLAEKKGEQIAQSHH